MESYWSQLRQDDRIYTNIGLVDKVDEETDDDFTIRKLLEYLIALMAKDCSIMITMQKLSQDYTSYSSQSFASAHVITDDITGAKYVANIAITDLDQKSIHKVEEFYKSDLQIVDVFKTIHSEYFA